MKSRRQHVLKIRLSGAEWAHFQTVFPQRAVGTSLRALALGQPAPRRNEVAEGKRDVTRHLARIGNNLNQIAHGINRAAISGEKIAAVRIAVELAAIRAAMEALW
jgi:hypothetical protein